uniref:(northern house mosquito) hypothetical protein n=1 Tax=Culex pipiens TaxID=7175 RepID=A0A8D8GMA8_CULPI
MSRDLEPGFPDDGLHTHTHGGGRAYALFTAVCPRSAARSTVWGSTVRSNCLVVFPLLFFPLFTTVFPHTHSLSLAFKLFRLHLSLVTFTPKPGKSTHFFYVKLIFLFFFALHHRQNFTLLYLTKYLLAFGELSVYFFSSSQQRATMMGILGDTGILASRGKAPREVSALLPLDTG